LGDGEPGKWRGKEKGLERGKGKEQDREGWKVSRSLNKNLPLRH